MSSEPAAKRQKSTKTIGTHSGTFHADEALGVALLRHTTLFHDSPVTRSRDPAVLAKLDIVIDVGGVYDHEAKRYDHHQRGFEEVFGEGHDVKLSSAGLVYKHYGKEVIQNICNYQPSDPRIEVLWKKVYKEFIEAIDAIDNGINVYPTSLTDTLPARYNSRTDLSSRVGWLNPRWNEEYNDEILDTKFAQASSLAGQEFMDRLGYYANAWLPARQLVVDAMESRFEVPEFNGQVLIFDRSLPWKEHLHTLETTYAYLPSTNPSKPSQLNPSYKQIIYVLYPDGPEGGSWRIQAVPVKSEGFESRKALPESWRGVRDDKLSEVTGIEGCIFAHASGFIGGNKSKQGAIEMAKAALKA